METPLLLVAGLVAVAIAIVVFARTRREGIVNVPPAGPSAPGASHEIGEPPGTPYGAELRDDQLVPIRHPLVRRTAEQALRRQSSMSRYIVRRPEGIYLTFEPFDDPEERRKAYELFRRFNAGEQIDLQAMLGILRKMQ